MLGRMITHQEARQSGREGVTTDTVTREQNVLPALLECIDWRFISFSSGTQAVNIYQHIMWLNRANLRNDILSELDSMQTFANHFSTTLEAAGFDGDKIKHACRNMKIIAKSASIKKSVPMSSEARSYSIERRNFPTYVFRLRSSRL